MEVEMFDAMAGFGAAFGALTAMAGLISLISTVVAIVSIIAQWKMFVKMGEPGWTALIPFYNVFKLAEHAFGSGWYLFVLFIPVVGIPWFFMKLFQGFGVDTVPAVLLALFVAPIGMMIYGFNSTPWQGM